MALFRFLRGLFDILTWSQKPRWVTPPLQGTKFLRGRYLKRVWVHEDLSRANPGKIYLGLAGIDISYIRDRRDLLHVHCGFQAREITAEQCREFLSECLALPALDELPHSDRSGEIFRLDLAITEMSPGFYGLRYIEWGTLLGLGHAYLQVEGVLSEPHSGKEMMKFVTRRRNSDSLHGGKYFPCGETRDPVGFQNP